MMANILAKILRISLDKLECNYLKNKKFFSFLYCRFEIYNKFWVFFKNIFVSCLSISEVINSEIDGYLMSKRSFFRQHISSQRVNGA